MRNVLSMAVLCLAATPWVGAQTVYRCGSTYSDAACPGATAVSAKPDPRTPAEAARAANFAERDMKLANAMEKSRLAQEARAPKAVVMAHSKADEPPTAPAPAQLVKGKKAEHFSAVEPRKPGEGKSKKKAARA